MIEVINMHHTPDFGKRCGDVKCDRSTRWGNPFIMYESSMRFRVCSLYEDYLDFALIPGESATVRKLLILGGLTEVQADMWMEKIGEHLDLTELKDAKRLGCWCKRPWEKDGGPICHCDYLKKKIEELTTPPLDRYGGGDD